MGLDISYRLTDRGIELPYVSIDADAGFATGKGIGARGMALVLAVADRYGKDVLTCPTNGGSCRFFERLGFAWPEEETLCPETDLLLMVRRPGACMRPEAIQDDAPRP